MNPQDILNLLLGSILPVFHVVTAVFEGDTCAQGDAHRRDCVVCLCGIDETWSCKRDMCDDCEDGTMKTRDNYNYFCDNGRWIYVPFFQLPGDQVVLPFGPCKDETFKPDWPCNRCRCNANNVWECPLVLCREETMLKESSQKMQESKLDKLYEFFKYDGKKEVCKEGETRDEDSCNTCKCENETWWCELRLCPELAEDVNDQEVDQGVKDTHQNVFGLEAMQAGMANEVRLEELPESNEIIVNLNEDPIQEEKPPANPDLEEVQDMFSNAIA